MNNKPNASILDVDLTRLTITGWILATLAICIAVAVAGLVAYQLSAAGFRGKVVAGVCLPIAIGVFAGVFWTASRLFSAIGIPLVRDEPDSADVTRHRTE